MAKQNAIDVWASGAKQGQYGFIKAIIFGLEQFQSGNRLPLTKMIALSNGKTWNGKSDVKLTGFSTPIKRVLDKALSDCKLTFKDGKSSWVVGDNGGVNADVVSGLRVLAAVPHIHVGHEAFKKAFPAPDKNAPVVTNKLKNARKASALKSLEKTAKELGMSVQEFLAFLSAKDDLPE